MEADWLLSPPPRHVAAVHPASTTHDWLSVPAETSFESPGPVSRRITSSGSGRRGQLLDSIVASLFSRGASAGSAIATIEPPQDVLFVVDRHLLEANGGQAADTESATARTAEDRAAGLIGSALAKHGRQDGTQSRLFSVSFQAARDAAYRTFAKHFPAGLGMPRLHVKLRALDSDGPAIESDSHLLRVLSAWHSAFPEGPCLPLIVAASDHALQLATARTAGQASSFVSGAKDAHLTDWLTGNPLKPAEAASIEPPTAHEHQHFMQSPVEELVDDVAVIQSGVAVIQSDGSTVTDSPALGSDAGFNPAADDRDSFRMHSSSQPGSSPQLPVNASSQLPVDTSPQLPVDVSSQLPMDASSQLPVDTSSQLPVDTSSQLPVDTSSQLPVDTSSQLPVDTRDDDDLLSNVGAPRISATSGTKALIAPQALEAAQQDDWAQNTKPDKEPLSAASPTAITPRRISLLAQELQALREQRSREGQLAQVAAAAASPHATAIARQAEAAASSVPETIIEDSELIESDEHQVANQTESVSASPAVSWLPDSARSTPRRRQLLVSTQWSVKAAIGSAAIARTDTTPRRHHTMASLQGIVIGNPRHLAQQLEEARNIQPSLTYAGSEQLDAGSEQLDAGSEQLDAGSEQLDAGSEQLDADSEQLDAGSEQLDADSEQLDAGAEGFDQRRNDSEHEASLSKPLHMLSEADSDEKEMEQEGSCDGSDQSAVLDPPPRAATSRPRLPPPPGASSGRPRLPPPPPRQASSAPKTTDE